MPRALSSANHRRVVLRRVFGDIALFSRYVLRRPLRGYQLPIARAIVRAVLCGRGETLAVMMARQAGKNEISAQVEAFLLNLYRRRGGELVKAAPTFRPQALNSLRRLQSVLGGSRLPSPDREEGHILRVGNARALFFSAADGANVVGATASLLLEADEAQDIAEHKWNKDFRPMGASANVTTVLWGTAWTAHTLLARTIRHLQAQELRDGRRRVFVVPWQRVAEEEPAYGAYVQKEIARLGGEHPLILTQYALQEIDEGAGLFPPATRLLMRGRHERQRTPTEGRAYALLVDVAGEAELQSALPTEGAVASPRRDATAVTIVEIAPGELGLPRYLVMDRYHWVGTPHHQLYGALLHLAEMWSAVRLVVDATGVGMGLASFLKKALGARVLPFTFTGRTKSELGWAFLGICNSGRFLDHREDGSPEQAQFWREVAAADYTIVEGPNRLMRWGVADPTVHDDLLLSAALCAALEEGPRPPQPSLIVEPEEV